MKMAALQSKPYACIFKMHVKCPLTVCRCHDWSKCCVITILVSWYLHTYLLTKMYTMRV